MSEQIISILNAICEKFGMAIDWTQQNVLPYVQQLISKIVNFEIATSIVWIAIASIVIITTNVLHRKWTKRNDFDWGELAWFSPRPIILLGLIIASIIFTIVICVQIFDIITCLVFPEKIILDFVKNSGLLN